MMLSAKGICRRQRGYVLGFSSLSLALSIGAMSAVSVDWVEQSQTQSMISSQAATYAQINRAMGNYVTLYYPQLTSVSAYPDACSTATFRAGSLVPTAPGASCSGALAVTYSAPAGGIASVSTDPAAVTRVPVGNVFQPTISELKQLKLLDAALPEAPLPPVNRKVATGPAPAGTHAARTDNIYGTTVRRIPVTGGFNFETLVFNIQPYVLSRDQMSLLLRHSNGMGAMSGTADDAATGNVLNPDFALASVGASWQRPNPVRQSVARTSSSGATTTAEVGMPGIVAWLNSYDTTASLTLMRREGALSPTADWTFADHDLTNVGRLQAEDLSVVQTAEIGNALGVAGIATVLRDLTVAGTSRLYKLVVAGPAVFQGPVQFNDDVKAYGSPGSGQRVRVTVGDATEKTVIGEDQVSTPAVTTGGMRTGSSGTRLDAGTRVQTGGICSLSLALAQDADTGRMVICGDGVWSLVSFDSSILQPPPKDSSCAPDGALTLFADGTVAVCRDRRWTTAFQPGVVGQPCALDGALSSYTTGQGVSSLLVCKGRKWSEDIYSKPMLGVVEPGSACRTDEINAVARSNDGAAGGVLMCTGDGRGGATWALPFDQYRKTAFIDYNEYLRTSFYWQNADPLALDGGDRIMPAPGESQIRLRHVVNGVVKGSTVATFTRYWGEPYASAPPFSSLNFVPGPADENPALVYGNPLWGSPCNSSYIVTPERRPILTTIGCGNDWTNPRAPDPTGSHPGVSCVNGGPGLNSDVEDIYWWERSFRINYHSRGSGWGTCTITLYRIVTKTFVMNH